MTSAMTQSCVYVNPKASYCAPDIGATLPSVQEGEVPRARPPNEPWAPSKALVTPQRDWLAIGFQVAAIIGAGFVAWLNINLAIAEIKGMQGQLQVEVNAEVQARQDGHESQDKRLDRLERLLFERDGSRNQRQPPRGNPDFLNTPPDPNMGG